MDKENMKIGILFCGYNTIDYLDDSLAPFLNDDRFIISAVSVPFLEYKNQEDYNDGTTEKLIDYKENGDIHYLTTFPKYIKEYEARNIALDFLKKDGVDYIFIVDSDEIYTKEDLNRIIQYVEDNPCCWYRVCLKNFVFDKNTYLKEPFSPPRIFATNFKDYSLHNMYWDNDFCYWNKSDSRIFKYDQIQPKDTIPKEVAWIDHYSWLNDEIGKRKVNYQQDRGWNCSFKWDERNGLTFNEKYYKLNNIEMPELVKV